MSCFLHKKTLELVSIPDSRRFPGMDWEDEDSEWAPGLKRATSDPDFIDIDSMDSHESFEIMEDFVFSLPEGRVRVQMETAIGGHKPFANFNHLIHQAGREREEWFAFKRERMKSWVAKQLEWKFSDRDEEEEE